MENNSAFWQGDSHCWTLSYCVKYLITMSLGLVYKLIFKFFAKKPRNTKYGLVLCAIFKNEAPHLKEWIEYHLLVGVEHFYLYNNNSTDHFREVLQPYVDNGTVTLTEWPETPGQITAYKHWYENFDDKGNNLMVQEGSSFTIDNKVNIRPSVNIIHRYEKRRKINVYLVRSARCSRRGLRRFPLKL